VRLLPDGDDALRVSRTVSTPRHGYLDADRYLARCPVCGWWHLDKSLETKSGHYDFFSAYGRLKTLDLRDISTPLEEIRCFLAAKYESRFVLNPFLLEETVASVFGDSGYRTRVTARSGDGGIDVYMDGPSGSLIGVQVKR
jgi:restriction system protein